ncbi:MAG: AAA family ATPase [Desulfobulbus sp.]|nr:AAA family ATPase [Desulfobulbus sp.]
MEAIIFCGVQAVGKSTFYQDHFSQTHVRISLDLLRTRRRERIFLAACLESGQRFVVDNTNPTEVERRVYIQAAKEKRFKVIGYYFASKAEEALSRNAARPKNERVPDVAIKATLAKLERPSWSEGFDELYHVAIKQKEFIVSEWHHAL